MTTDVKHPQHVQDKEKTAEALSKVINIDKADILDILNKDAKQVEFGSAGRDITYSQKQRSKAETPGHFIFTGYKTLLSKRRFASNLIGYAEVDQDTNEISGAMGLEKVLDKYLKERTDMWLMKVTNPAGSSRTAK